MLNYITLNRMLPKRWNLLLRYYLPFLKTPPPFYFKCREFIDKLNRKSPNDFPLTKLTELLDILANYSENDPELIRLAKNIIATLSEQQIKHIDHSLLQQLLQQFCSENTKTSILNDLLTKIPPQFYDTMLRNISYDAALALVQHERLIEKFSFSSKLALCLGLPAKTVIHQSKFIYSLVTTLEHSDTPQELIPDRDKFVAFISQWQKTLSLSNERVAALL